METQVHWRCTAKVKLDSLPKLPEESDTCFCCWNAVEDASGCVSTYISLFVYLIWFINVVVFSEVMLMSLQIICHLQTFCSRLLCRFSWRCIHDNQWLSTMQSKRYEDKYFEVKRLETTTNTGIIIMITALTVVEKKRIFVTRAAHRKFSRFNFGCNTFLTTIHFIE